MLKIDTIDTYEKLQRIQPLWNEAFEQSDVQVPFMTFEWISSWWKTCARDNKILIFVVTEEGKPPSIVPLLRTRARRRGFWLSTLTFPDYGIADRAGFLLGTAGEVHFAAIVDHLRALPDPYDILYFSPVESGSVTGKAVRAVARTYRLPLVEYAGQSSPYLPIRGTWKDYLKTRSQHFRRDMKKTMNGFDRQGNVEIVRYATNGIEQGLEEMMAVSRNTWKAETKTAIAVDDDLKNFYSFFARTAADKEWLQLWVLKLNATPVAFAFNIVLKRKVFSLKIGYDERLENLYPGKYLIFHMIKDCFDTQQDEFDFLGKNDQFKMRWTPLSRQHVRFVIYGDTPNAKALYFLEARLINQVKKFLLSLHSLSRPKKNCTGSSPGTGGTADTPVSIDN